MKKRGVPVEHWEALKKFASCQSLDARESLHGARGKGSPFSDLARFVGGWSRLKHWDIKQCDQTSAIHVVDSVGRLLIPSECFGIFIYAAALETYLKHDHLDGRISPAAVIETLAAANISAGVPSGGVGGRPSLFSISVPDVIATLSLEAGCGAASWNGSCTIDAALANLAAARRKIVETPNLRRFLSSIPASWPTAANTVVVIDEFRSGQRCSLIFSGGTTEYLRRKVEALASLMGVCMVHTNTYEARSTGSRLDIYRCHRRRRQPKVRTKPTCALHLLYHVFSGIAVRVF